VLAILWLFGYVTNNTIGNFLHVLLVVALLMVVIDFVKARGKKG
jgi:hypothetical protein